MNVLVLDVETTSSNKGNPFDNTNRCLLIGLKFLGQSSLTFTPHEREQIQDLINKSALIVGFNIKFDLHWLRKLGIDFSSKRVWDCQIGEFILGNQNNPYPSLNQALEKYGFPLKLDIVKEEYWNKGKDTSEVPMDILKEYLKGDLEGTEQVYLKQVEQYESNNKQRLFNLQCLDLLVLEEMEWNGIRFNTEKAKKYADEISKKTEQLYRDITVYTSGVPINLNSDDHVSCLLYGGTITEDIRIPIGEYRTGLKVGQTRYKIVEKKYELPRLIEPLKGTERAKEGYWFTNEDVLRSLKPSKEGKRLLEIIKEFTKLEKLKSTYLLGWSKLIDEMNWERDTIHGNLNQCVVITGRLSSTKPNLQNADPITKIFCESRYD